MHTRNTYTNTHTLSHTHNTHTIHTCTHTHTLWVTVLLSWLGRRKNSVKSQKGDWRWTVELLDSNTVGGNGRNRKSQIIRTIMRSLTLTTWLAQYPRKPHQCHPPCLILLLTITYIHFVCLRLPHSPPPPPPVQVRKSTNRNRESWQNHILYQHSLSAVKYN